MTKSLNKYGKLLYLFTVFFPLYVYWAYFSLINITSLNLRELYRREILVFFLLCFCAISSIIVFFFVLLRKQKHPEKEINVKTSEKKSNYFREVIGVFPPIILFLSDFLDKSESSMARGIIGTVFMIIIWTVLIFKDGKGILYNIFYLPYHILDVTTNDNKRYVIITKKDHLSGYTKLNQLDREVFKEWN